MRFRFMGTGSKTTQRRTKLSEKTEEAQHKDLWGRGLVYPIFFHSKIQWLFHQKISMIINYITFQIIWDNKKTQENDDEAHDHRHPKMETSLFGKLNEGKFLKSGDHPGTAFFFFFLATFTEMAMWVWLLHSVGYEWSRNYPVVWTDGSALLTATQ